MAQDQRHVLIVYFLNNLFEFSKLIGFTDFTQLHQEMCDDLVNFLLTNKRKRVMWLYPRGSFKTSLFSVAFPLWAYLQSFYGIGPLEPIFKPLKCWGNGGLRVLLCGSTLDNASRRLVMIEKVVQTNENFRAIFEEVVPDKYHDRTWNTTACEMPRKGLWQEPTFEAVGVGGKITGRHYLMAIKDDLIGEEDLGPDGLPKPSAVREVIQWHDYFDALFQSVPKAIDIIVGTRWGEEDFAGYIIKEDKRYKVFKRQAIENGRAIFPERIPLSFLEELRKRKPYMFATQYMNDVDDDSITEMKVSWLQRFEWLGARKPDGRVRIEHADDMTEELSVSFFDRILIIDPAFSLKSKADPTGMLVTGYDHKQRFYILDEWCDKMLPERLIRTAFAFARKWQCRCIGIESVAAQRVVGHFARYIMEQEDFYIPIVSLQPSTRVSKRQRIRGVIPLLFEGRILANRETTPEVIDEMKHFPTGKDHLLDCLAYAPTVHRTPPEPPVARPTRGGFVVTWEDLFDKKDYKLYRELGRS